MKIARLTPHYYWPQLADKGWPVKFDAIGGMQSQIYRLATSLSELPTSQKVFTLKIPGAPEYWKANSNLEVIGTRIPIFPIVSKVRGMVDLNVSWALGVLKAFLPQNKKFDIIHVHCSGVMWPPILGALLNKITGKPLILTLHCSILSTYHPMCFLDHILGPIAKWCEKIAIKKSSKVICLTSRAAKRLQTYLPALNDKLIVIGDGIDLADFLKTHDVQKVDELKERYNLKRFRKTVGFLGRIAREKGWPWLVEIALRTGEDVGFLIGGDGNEMAELREMVAKNQLEFRFVFCGYVPQADVPNFLPLMDVMLLCSEHEEFGGILLEAMACKTPIVCFNVGGISAVIGEGYEAGMVEYGNADAMATRVTDFLDDAKLTQKLVEYGVSRVPLFDMKEAAQKTLNVYQTVLEAS